MLIARKIPVVQGDYAVSDVDGTIMSTVLGSCVAACIFDPEARVGGMNHFLLPGNPDRDGSDQSRRYGVYLMEMLLNALYQKGAERSRLRVKLFGGARVIESTSDAGAKNAEFAENFIRNEGLALVSTSLGGFQGRRIEFEPTTGKARQKFIGIAVPEPEPRTIEKQLENAGDVDFF
ncbi:chemotaxis protein CheD [Oricola thermophila]|uniref:Probable chemoreceptor glutamine deamidase CheD n=1 Tax=Oricola thermophila TaxID=2742145 RepID=A0A6N1VIQ1_9HYPH|nr:chemotaxis protein CheD [Oricola thermophila]QKV19605.1 chemotaxis protein CheD [Oricola thermophila]